MSYQCKIWLDNYSGQYYPGSVIQGRVICNFDSETSLRAIKVRVKAEEHTEWLGEETYHDPQENRDATRQVLFKGDNDVFSQQIILYGSESGTTSLSAGQHFYPFTFNLPYALPASFTCQYGSIIFKIKAIVDRPMARDYEDVAMFNIISPVDLNKFGPDILEPTSYSDEKTTCCLCCASGPITLDAQLAKRAIIPGEVVTLSVRLTNMSNVNVEAVKLNFNQLLKYKTQTPSEDSKAEENYLFGTSDVGVGAHGEHNYEFKIDIPTTTIVPNFDQCRLFEASYKMILTAVLPSYHTNLDIVMHPIVGNVPVGQQPQNIQPPPMNNQPQPGFVPPGAPYPPPPGNFPPYNNSNLQGPYPGVPQEQFQPQFQGPYQGGPGYPANPYPGGAFPPGGPYPPPTSGPYPGYPPASAPYGGDSKAQEAAQNSGNPSAPRDLPPSYDSLNMGPK